MIDNLVAAAIRFRGLVVLAVIGVIVLGVYLYAGMPVDAFPDISPIMVPIFAEAHGMAPEEIERLISYPIEAAMNGLPGVTLVKSTSAFGMAVIYVYFRDDIDIYFARQVVAERLAGAAADLPRMHEPPSLGPISTGLGQIFMYYLTLKPGADTEGKEPLTYLREINDWVVKFQLQTVPGVTDILSIGGHVLQYQIRVNPFALRKYGLALDDLVAAVQNNNRNAGGQFLVLGAEEYLVRGIGLATGLDDIRAMPVKVEDGVPVTIGDVAEVGFGNEIRRGVVTRNGEEEAVSGIVLKLFGENTSEVIDGLYAKVAELQRTLPAGVAIVPYYEQAQLVANATWTVKKALLQGAVLVVLALALFLGNLRTAFIVVLALPICALVAVIGMRAFDISANLMSLGGIAIAVGMLVDGAIVMVENIFRHLNAPERGAGDKAAVILAAAREVGRPIVFSVCIVIIVFLPIFSLQGVEGKMFSDLAVTIALALVGSILVALMVAPAAAHFVLRERAGGEEYVFVRKLKSAYRPMVAWAVRRRGRVLLIALAGFCASLAALPFVGTEFIPTLEEGSILIGVTMAPSISLEKATETVMGLERRIMRFPAVREIVSRIGRPEAGSHPHPVNYAEVHIELAPERGGGGVESKRELIDAINAELAAVPGVQLNFTQPIQNAFDELLSGIRAQIAVKLFGEDLDVLREKAADIHAAVEGVPGLVDLSVEQSFGQPQVQVIADRSACARYGVTVAQILELVELAVGGEVIDNIFINTRRYGIHVRYLEPFRMDPGVLGDMLLHTRDGAVIPLSQVAEIREVAGPIQINRENNQRRWIVQGNVRGRDLGGVVEDIRERIGERVELPPGYYIEYGGQFENQQRAMARLSIIVPAVIAAVFVVLWITFSSVVQAFLVITNVPLALIGGIFGLIIMGEYLSVPASVGFIALFGIAVQNGVVLVSCINQFRAAGVPRDEAIVEGGVQRLRPVLLTSVTTLLGLLPLLLSGGIGAEVQRPLAVVVVFGLATSTLLTLFVIPAAIPSLERLYRPKSG